MKRFRFPAIMIVVIAVQCSGLHAEPLKFVAMGDMPYKSVPHAIAKFDALVAAINSLKPALTVHVGDTKQRKGSCSTTVLDTAREQINTIVSPVIYTPGDNEWTDCKDKPGESPKEALAYIRKTYFEPSTTLGGSNIPLERQADAMPNAKKFVENVRLRMGDFLFVTVHVVGSNNNLNRSFAEHAEREKANIGWLENSFQKAKELQSKAVVIALHADMFHARFNQKTREFKDKSGFKRVGEKLRDEARNFDRPVLLIFGDEHTFEESQPFPNKASNLKAIRVFGKTNCLQVQDNL